ADRLLEPRHPPRRVGVGVAKRALGDECAVRVDVELRVVADREARDADTVEIAGGLPPDLHLDAWNAVVDPARELTRELLVCVRAETAAAVDGRRLVDR